MVVKNYEYDVFISYAVEDKIGIVNELVQKLEESGIKVWYASHKLRVEGLNRSKHGILILSPNYLVKTWPKKEYHALWAREKEGARKILPIWHNISEDEIKAYDPILADSFGLDSGRGLDYVVKKLVESLKEGEERTDSVITSKSDLGGKKNSIFRFIWR